MKKDWTEANIKQINSMRNNLIKYYRGKTDDREISLDDIKNKAIIEKIVSDNNYDFIGTHHNKIYQIYDKPSYGSEQKKKIASIIYKYFELKKTPDYLNIGMLYSRSTLTIYLIIIITL